MIVVAVTLVTVPETGGPATSFEKVTVAPVRKFVTESVRVTGLVVAGITVGDALLNVGTT